VYIECRHIFSSGNKCHSPSLRDKHYCYFHANLHQLVKPGSKTGELGLRLPALEDRRSIQIALTQVLEELAAGGGGGAAGGRGGGGGEC